MWRRGGISQLHYTSATTDIEKTHKASRVTLTDIENASEIWNLKTQPSSADKERLFMERHSQNTNININGTTEQRE